MANQNTAHSNLTTTQFFSLQRFTNGLCRYLIFYTSSIILTSDCICLNVDNCRELSPLLRLVLMNNPPGPGLVKTLHAVPPSDGVNIIPVT